MSHETPNEESRKRHLGCEMWKGRLGGWRNIWRVESLSFCSNRSRSLGSSGWVVEPWDPGETLKSEGAGQKDQRQEMKALRAHFFLIIC